MFHGFADPTRLSILESLRGGEKTVGAIAAATRQSQSNVSNHLSYLRERGLVIARREGKSIYYSIASERVKSLLTKGNEVISEVGMRKAQPKRHNQPYDS